MSGRGKKEINAPFEEEEETDDTRLAVEAPMFDSDTCDRSQHAPLPHRDLDPDATSLSGDPPPFAEGDDRTSLDMEDPPFDKVGNDQTFLDQESDALSEPNPSFVATNADPTVLTDDEPTPLKPELQAVRAASKEGWGRLSRDLESEFELASLGITPAPFDSDQDVTSLHSDSEAQKNDPNPLFDALAAEDQTELSERAGLPQVRLPRAEPSQPQPDRERPFDDDQGRTELALKLDVEPLRVAPPDLQPTDPGSVPEDEFEVTEASKVEEVVSNKEVPVEEPMKKATIEVHLQEDRADTSLGPNGPAGPSMRPPKMPPPEQPDAATTAELTPSISSELSMEEITSESGGSLRLILALVIVVLLATAATWVVLTSF